MKKYTCRTMGILLLLACGNFQTHADEGEVKVTNLQPAQNPNAAYRLFPTRNFYVFLKLDTRSGLIWQVQWSTSDDERFIVPLNGKMLTERGTPGRFTLYPTVNFYNFLLVDQETGQVWQVQWSTKRNERIITPLNHVEPIDSGK